jgi:hypothetical protein
MSRKQATSFHFVEINRLLHNIPILHEINFHYTIVPTCVWIQWTCPEGKFNLCVMFACWLCNLHSTWVQRESERDIRIADSAYRRSHFHPGNGWIRKTYQDKCHICGEHCSILYTWHFDNIDFISAFAPAKGRNTRGQHSAAPSESEDNTAPKRQSPRMEQRRAEIQAEVQVAIQPPLGSEVGKPPIAWGRRLHGPKF